MLLAVQLPSHGHLCKQVRLEEDELAQLLSMHEHVQHCNAIFGKAACTSNLCTSNVFADRSGKLPASTCVCKIEPHKVFGVIGQRQFLSIVCMSKQHCQLMLGSTGSKGKTQKG